jgi:hypothetical protein
MISVDRGQKVRFLNFRDFGIFIFTFLRMTSYLKMTIIRDAIYVEESGMVEVEMLPF